MRILLFEDHSALANSIIKGLAGHGFGVDAFSSAGDGLDAFKSVTYDAIILDLGLPDRDGLRRAPRIERAQFIRTDPGTHCA